MRRILWMTIIACVAVEVVWAHRLTVAWEVRDGRLVIAADSEGEVAAGADVELRSADGRCLAAGVLDAAGKWEWPLQGEGDLTVAVDAGLGHRRSLTLTGEQLRSPAAAASSTRAGSGASDERAPGSVQARGSSDAPIAVGWRVALGLTLVLAAGAAWMSLCNSRRVSELERRWRNHEGRG
jgi:hypothetical protein